MNEVFRPLKNYEDKYLISNYGYVIDLSNNKKLKEYSNPAGYKYVLIKNSSSNNNYIHTLLAKTFLNHIPCKKERVVDHINNDKTDNRLCNLQIITNRQNSIKDKKPKSGESCIYLNSGSYLLILRIKNIKVTLGTFKKIEDAVICRDNFLKLSYSETLKYLDKKIRKFEYSNKIGIYKN